MLTKVSNGKGKIVGYIAISGGFTTVLWIGNHKHGGTVAMTFKGNASVLFMDGDLVVATTADGNVNAPKSMTKTIDPLGKTKDSIRLRTELFEISEWTALELVYDRVYHGDSMQSLEQIVIQQD